MYKIIGIDGKEYGPVSAEQARQWVTEGRARADSLARAEGNTDWKPLSSFPELAVPAAPPPLPASTVAASPSGGVVATIIPYKNVPALVAYYCAVFSLIPCVGAILGLVALVLGVIGLRRARLHPEAKGKVHAWIGIIVGGIFGLLWLGVIISGFVAAMHSARYNRY